MTHSKRDVFSFIVVIMCCTYPLSSPAEPDPRPTSADPPKQTAKEPSPAEPRGTTGAAAPAEIAPLSPLLETETKTTQPPATAGDPFARLPILLRKEQLPPIRSVRLRDKQEQEDRSRTGKISIRVSTSPPAARVLYGGKFLGTTPLTLTAQRGSTPFDVVIQHKGFMLLRTRIMRKHSRSYSFKLTPAKFH